MTDRGPATKPWGTPVKMDCDLHHRHADLAVFCALWLEEVDPSLIHGYKVLQKSLGVHLRNGRLSLFLCVGSGPGQESVAVRVRGSCMEVRI